LEDVKHQSTSIVATKKKKTMTKRKKTMQQVWNVQMEPLSEGYV
jgi:hypothetical protein